MICASPIVDNRLELTPAWTLKCFAPAFARARLHWGTNASAITTEILEDLVPQMRVLEPDTGAERELRRRIHAAVAALLNRSGIATRYPEGPRTPRPLQIPVGPPWYRALLTGWLR